MQGLVKQRNHKSKDITIYKLYGKTVGQVKSSNIFLVITSLGLWLHLDLLLCVGFLKNFLRLEIKNISGKVNEKSLQLIAQVYRAEEAHETS